MNIIKDINWKQGKYMLPAILYLPILGTSYLVIDIFHTDVAKADNGLETTEYLNSKLPDAQNSSDIGSKYENMVRSYGKIQDYTAVENIDADDDKMLPEGYDSKYSDDELAMLDGQAPLDAQEEMLRRLAESARIGQEMGQEQGYMPDLSDSARLARTVQRQQETIDELNRELAEARLRAMSEMPQGSMEQSQQGVSAPPDDAEAIEVVKKVEVSSDYFNTIAENETEPRLIKAIIDENVKAVDGSRVRLRLLDDVVIGETVVPKGSYLYAEMSGFGSQRVKGSVKSLLIDDELVKVSLSLYDTDGLEGLYVPSSSFRETTKDVASSAMSGNMNMGGNATGSIAQWGMQAAQNAYQKTTNAISKAIKKNRVKLKYGTFVYLVNSNSKSN